MDFDQQIEANMRALMESNKRSRAESNAFSARLSSIITGNSNESVEDAFDDYLESLELEWGQVSGEEAAERDTGSGDSDGPSGEADGNATV